MSQLQLRRYLGGDLMSAHRLIDQFAGDGIRLTVENGQIVFEGPREVLTPERIDELRQHKTELLAALIADQIDAFEERSAIIQFDAYFSRREAERRARNEQHPVNGGNAA